MSTDFNLHLRAAILEAVEDQITNNTAPTYERIPRESRSERAKVLIANIVAIEISRS